MSRMKILWLIENCPFTIITTVIDKRLLKEQFPKPNNPYELALIFCLRRTYKFLKEKGQDNKLTHIIIESRGKKEDSELAVSFQSIIKDEIENQKQYPCALLFADKKTNNIGLQIADLAAYPIGRYVVDPYKENLAYNIITKKLHKFPDHMDTGLKIFPYEVNRFLIAPSEKQNAPDHSEAVAD